MRKAPAFQFYARDWLASSTVSRMPLDVQGAFVRLLCYQAEDGLLPCNAEEIRELLKIHPRQWPRFWKYLEPVFPLCDDGSRRNPKQLEVLTERQAFIEQRSRAGIASATKRATAAQRNGNIRSTVVESPLASRTNPASASASEGQSQRPGQRARAIYSEAERAEPDAPPPPDPGRPAVASHPEANGNGNTLSEADRNFLREAEARARTGVPPPVPDPIAGAVAATLRAIPGGRT